MPKSKCNAQSETKAWTAAWATPFGLDRRAVEARFGVQPDGPVLGARPRPVGGRHEAVDRLLVLLAHHQQLAVVGPAVLEAAGTNGTRCMKMLLLETDASCNFPPRSVCRNFAHANEP